MIRIRSMTSLPFFWRTALAGLSGFLFFLCLPAPNQGWLAWIALVPLVWACQGTTLRQAMILGLLYGIISHFLIFLWIFHVPQFHWYHACILAFYLGLYPAVWCGALALLPKIQFYQLLIAPAFWVILDYFRAHAGFLAFSWGSMAYTQHENLPILQIMSLTGEYGLTFLLIAINMAAYIFLSKKCIKVLAVTLAVAMGIWVWGFFSLTHTPVASQTVNIALVQPSILLEERKTEAGLEHSLQRLEHLTQSAAQQHPDCIVWPETALRDFPKNTDQANRIKKLVKQIQIPIIFGASEYEKYALSPDLQTNQPVGIYGTLAYNSAFLLFPNGTLEKPYRKQRLVPFAEYLPWQPWCKWPHWLIEKSYHITPGSEPELMILDSGLVVAPIICWENLFADFIYPLVKDGANIIVQLTNNNHFGFSAASRQHNIASQFRAIENRTPIVVASNTGPSIIFDSQGRTLAVLDELFQENFIHALIPLEDKRIFYFNHPDWLAWVCIFWTFLNLMLMIVRHYKPR